MNRIFLTGASGYLGSAVAARLARTGQELVALTRDEQHAGALERIGANPLVGDLGQPESYMAVLKNCDAAVHMAVSPELGEAARMDQVALAAFADAAEDGRLRRLLYTSGFWVYGDPHGAVVEDAAPLAPLDLVAWRAAHEEVVMDLATLDVVPVVFRPAIVYGESRGILAEWFREARERGTVTIPGDGSQIWGLVHRDDVAEAYALGLEHAAAADRFLLADGSTHSVRELADAVARVTGATVTPQPEAEVIATHGDYGKALLASGRYHPSKARRELGWVPRHTSFVNEVEDLFREWLPPREASVS